MSYIAVAGPGEASAEELALAEEVGRGLGARGAVVVCGGLGGVMEAVCKGAREVGGTTVGILAAGDRSDANSYLSVAIPTGLGQARNTIVVNAGDALIAIGGGYGTLSEIALALRRRMRVVGLRTWDIDGVEAVDSPEAAVETVLTDPTT